MNFVGHEIDDFKVNAYQDGETKEVTKQDGKNFAILCLIIFTVRPS